MNETSELIDFLDGKKILSSCVVTDKEHKVVRLELQFKDGSDIVINAGEYCLNWNYGPVEGRKLSR